LDAGEVDYCFVDITEIRGTGMVYYIIGSCTFKTRAFIIFSIGLIAATFDLRSLVNLPLVVIINFLSYVLLAVSTIRIVLVNFKKLNLNRSEYSEFYGSRKPNKSNKS